MSKRRYGSVEFKRVDWSGLAEGFGGGRAVLAVDVAKEDFVAAVLGPDAGVRVTFKWRHPGQTLEVLECLEGLAGAVALEVVLEPSGTYGDALVGQLRRRGVAVYRVSPKRVHDAAEVYDGVPSLHDAKACELIGRLHLQGVSRVWEALGQERRELNAWLRRLEVSKGRLHAGLNRLEAHLSRHWPEVLGLLELSSVTLSELVAAYGGPAAVAADPVGAEALMRRVGRAGLSEEAIVAVLASAHENLGLPCVVAESDLLQWLAADNNATRRELHAIEQEIQRRVAASAVPARLGNVVGKVSAAVLVAAVGDPQDYPDAASYTKAIGLNLKERSSGKHKGQLKITKRGPAVARFYLYFAALRLIARDPEVRRWYDRQNARPGALKGKTIVTLMRKLAQALWHVDRVRGGRSPRLPTEPCVRVRTRLLTQGVSTDSHRTSAVTAYPSEWLVPAPQ